MNQATLQEVGLDAGATIDPVTLEMIRHSLNAIPNLIESNISRTAYSPLIYEYKDFAVGIVDARARLVSQCKGGIPIFMANALGTAVKDGMEIYGEDGMAQGDVVITNYAGSMGQHLNNVVMYTPIRIGAGGAGAGGELAGYMAVVMHWIDIGGIIMGSCSANDTKEIYQEGIQFRTVKLYSGGQPNQDMYRMIRYNTRFPDMLMGDVEAQVAACFNGRDMVAEVIGRYGLGTVRAGIDAMLDQSEQVARAAIRDIPDGVYTAEAFLDNDGTDLERRIPVPISIRIEGDRITVDYSQVADQLNGPLNSGREGGAVAAARIACKYLLTPDEPANEGDFRALTVEIPDGKFLSAGPTAAMGHSGSSMPTVVDTILKAFADGLPTRVSAAHHGTYGIHVFHGVHPATGDRFQHLESSIGGWGAAHDKDGGGPHRSIVHGDTVDVPAEMQEAGCPLRLEYYRLRTDSGGPGKYRGGLGIDKAYRVLAPCFVIVGFDRTQCPPWGLKGGKAGATGYVEIIREGEAPRHITKANDVALKPGDLVCVRTGGGGGHGSPLEREPSRVAEDVRYGYITREAALLHYAVALDAAGKLLTRETAAARAAAGQAST